jgi:enamine deaminase RidA (YjgF/YER057c/UK114 family)
LIDRKLISSGSVFEQKVAYSRAVVDGDYVFVSGTTGYDYSNMTIADDVVEQAEQCFRNIDTALQAGGSSLAGIVRIRYIVTERKYFEPCWPVIQKYLGAVRPAATMIIAGLLDERMKLEIEVTARLNSS